MLLLIRWLTENQLYSLLSMFPLIDENTLKMINLINQVT